MSTVVVSDLHLGVRSGRDLLRSGAVRERLWAAIADAGQVVLLGDVVDLRQGPVSEVLSAARPFFAELGQVLGDRPVVLVPGNHDHGLLAGWHGRRAAAGAPPLGLEHRITPAAGDGAATALVGWARPARLELAYPGVWLREDVYATHGHLLDVHTTLPTLERVAIGALGLITGPLPARATPEDYEIRLAPLYALAHGLAQGRGRRGPDRPARGPWGGRLLLGGGGDRPPRAGALGPALPAVLAALRAAGLGDLRARTRADDLLPVALTALGELCVHLGLRAEWLVTGHVHRAGPWPGDDARAWVAPTGTRLVGTGSWVAEPALGPAAAPGGPGAPGTCVRVPGTGPPVAVRVLGGSGAGAGIGDRSPPPAVAA